MEKAIEAQKMVTKEEESSTATGSDDTLPSEVFSSWIHCFCVVTFDLELGQALELVYPHTAVLPESEITSICYMAFPDSNSGCTGDTKFHFRMRGNSRFYHGFVFFRQTKDKQLPRGYFQKSVVVITRWPLFNFFLDFIDIIAPAFFKMGLIAFETAYRHIASWPTVSSFDFSNKHLELPLLGSKLQLDTGDNAESLISPERLASEVDLYTCLSVSGLLQHLQLLWELVLLGEPLVVMASHPQACSQLVLALISLISPLEYCGDYRPYFTIHDVDLKEFSSRAHSPPPAVILGVTNPFFAKTLHHWPHVIRAASDGSLQLLSSAKLHRHSVRESARSSSSVFDTGSQGGLYTRYKAALRRDEAVLNMVAKGARLNRPSAVQTTILRRFLTDLTNRFLNPLEQYLQASLPLMKDINPFKEAPLPKPFDCSEFLAQLDDRRSGSSCKVRGDWATLYRRFFKSANFVGWHGRKHRGLVAALQLSHLEALSRADVHRWSIDRPEVEILDMVLRLRSKLENHGALSPVLREALEARLLELKGVLPEDVRELLVSPMNS